MDTSSSLEYLLLLSASSFPKCRAVPGVAALAAPLARHSVYQLCRCIYLTSPSPANTPAGFYVPRVGTRVCACVYVPRARLAPLSECGCTGRMPGAGRPCGTERSGGTRRWCIAGPPTRPQGRRATARPGVPIPARRIPVLSHAAWFLQGPANLCVCVCVCPVRVCVCARVRAARVYTYVSVRAS